MTSVLRRLRVSGWVLAPATILLAIVIPALAYTLIDLAAPGSLPFIQYLVAAAYALTATMTLMEARAALGEHDEPPLPDVDDPVALGELPTLTAIVSAYLPNEQELVADTIVHLATQVRVAPGSLQIILAYNTPEDMPDVERVLHSLAELNVAFLPVRVATSHSKAENVNAALRLANGEITVLLDADHRPARDAAARALRWFRSGYDIVQGRCVIRDYEDSWLARIVAVEFEQIYAVSHSGRSLAFDTAMFCGTNGWWRTSVLRQIGMDEQMLTEDIDSSVRSLLAGHRTIHDRSIISTELAPPSAKAWWGQRMRWAQGWFQVTLKHQGAIVRSPRLSGELKLYWTYLLGWRELFPVLSLQIFALLLANAILGRNYTWFYDPFLIITTVLTVIAGPLAAAMTYRVALPDHRRALRRWFVIYAACSLIYTTVKNTVAMVATVRELIGQRGWIVTRRATSAPRKALATTSALALVAITSLATMPALTADAEAASESRTIRLAPLATELTLTGRAPVTAMSVPLPHDWRNVRGTVRIRWQASPRVTPNSTFGVKIDGTLMAVAPLARGRGSIDVAVPRQRVDAHQLLIELTAQLHTRVDTQCCFPDAASGAVLAIDRITTRADLTGDRARDRPLLNDLPGSLVDVIGTHTTPLFIALPTQAAANDVRAAALIAGAVSRATVSRTVPIKIVRGAPVPRLLRLPGQVIRIQPTGTPRAAVTRRPDGRLLVTLGGKGDGALRAAWAISRARPRFLAGSAMRVTSGLDRLTGPERRTATITPVSGRGTGDLEYQAAFRLPESQELIDRKTHLVLNTAFNAPGGGRVEISLNGVPLLSRNLPKQGLGQARLSVDLVQDEADATEQRLALARLAAGDDFLTIRSNLPAGQPVGGSGDAQVPEFRILGSSLVRYSSRPREGRPSLDFWPWPYTGADGMTGATFVIPADPSTSELRWTIATIAEASRWTRMPLAPKIAIGPGSLPGGDVVVLARDDLTPAAPLPAGAPARPRLGALQTYDSGGRHILVAYGLRALRPLASNYNVSKVRGLAAVVTREGRIVTLVRAPIAGAFEKRPVAWQIPAAILVLGALALLGIRLRKVRERLEQLPPPRPRDPLEDAEIRAQLEEWERLVAQDGNAAKQRDDAPKQP